MHWLAVLHCAAALAFAGVLAGALVVAGFAAAFAFAGVLAGAVVGLAFLVVGEEAGNVRGFLGLLELRGVELEGSAREDAGDCSAGEDGLCGGVAFHVCFGFWFLWFSGRAHCRNGGSAIGKWVGGDRDAGVRREALGFIPAWDRACPAMWL